MKKITIIALVGLTFIFLLCPTVTASDTGLITDQHNIAILISDDGLDVEENIKIINTGEKNVTYFRFWLQQEAESDVSVLAVDSGTDLSYINMDSTTFNCSLEDYNITLEKDQSIDVRIKYTIPTETKYFVKTILYDTAALTITYEDEDLYKGEHLVYNEESNSVQILLHRPTETLANILYIVIIFILVVILIASTLLLMRKQRKKIKKSIVESEETLDTKKALLLSLLKDVEKKHRAKEISDETYSKLKEEYKQQAVEVMKKLDDIKN